MLLPRQAARPLVKRDSSSSKVAILVVVTIAVLVSAVGISYIILKELRKRHENPKYVPTQALKRRWRAWDPIRGKSQHKYSSRLQANDSTPTLHRRSARGSTLNLPETQPSQPAETTDANVNRHTSVRSVMTLPAYSSLARDDEQILGREGDRGGIDIVLEHPETADEEEHRREEEMDSLYQIRLQRRREIADREARRQERRDARARNDRTTLERLRQEALQRAQDTDLSGAAAMIAEHQSRSRDRRVSSVSYADLGVARHDGTRIRANSSESDSRPLLDSAASIAGSGGGASIRPPSAQDSYGRARSASSVLSISDTENDGEVIVVPPFGHAGNDFEIVNMNQSSHTHSRNPSQSHTPLGNRSRASSNTNRPVIDTSGGAISDTHIVPASDPPAYDPDGFEEAPPYSSPVEEARATQRVSTIIESPRDSIATPSSAAVTISSPTPTPTTTTASGAPSLPAIDRLPSIRIAAATPIELSRGVEWPESGSSTVGGER